VDLSARQLERRTAARSSHRRLSLRSARLVPKCAVGRNWHGRRSDRSFGVPPDRLSDLAHLSPRSARGQRRRVASLSDGHARRIVLGGWASPTPLAPGRWSASWASTLPAWRGCDRPEGVRRRKFLSRLGPHDRGTSPSACTDTSQPRAPLDRDASVGRFRLAVTVTGSDRGAGVDTTTESGGGEDCRQAPVVTARGWRDGRPESRSAGSRRR
jgi:hypothetical protein